MPTPTARTLERIADGGVIAVMRGVDPDAAVETARALRDGGVTAVEVTADTPGALDAIAELRAAFDDGPVVGAGTVLDAETATRVVDAGASFVVAPTTDPGTVSACGRYGVPVIPGATTPTEALRAVEAGADAVKLFPAATVGPGHLDAIRGPLPQIPLVPTGGVDLDNVRAFVEAGALAVGVGGALVGAVDDPAGVEERARRFVTAVDEAR